MGIFRLYTFNNVTSAASVLTNLKNVAESEGWTINSFSVSGLPSNPGYLYIASTGNGNQNLYYSMQLRSAIAGSFVRNFSNLFLLNIFGNTGYNSGQPYNNQPGKWTICPDFQSGCPYGYFVQLPVITQYIFANSSQILMFCDSNHSVEINFSYAWRGFSGRYNFGFYLGSMDSYKSNETEGNMLIVDGGYEISPTGVYILFSLFGNVVSTTYSSNNLLYFSANKYNNNSVKNLGLSVSFGFSFTSSYTGFHPDASTRSDCQLSFQYWRAMTFNDFTNKAVIIKPIIFIKHSISGYNYYFPIGELPYYASLHNPYFTMGQEVTYGNRKFVAMPIGSYTSPYGCMVEVYPS